VHEQIIFETTTKDWQTVNRRNVSRQTIPKSWSRHRKHACTDRCRRALVFPVTAVLTILRIEDIISAWPNNHRKFSVALHVNHLLVSWAQSLFAMRTLRHHGLSTDVTIFQASIVFKLSYASPVWWGFTSAADRDRLEALVMWSTTLGFHPAIAPVLGTICSEANDKLFTKITSH